MTLEEFTPRTRSAFWDDDRLLKFIIFVLVLVIVAVTVIFFQQRDLRSDVQAMRAAQKDIISVQDEAREQSFINRARNCRMEAALGLTLPPECLEPEVTAYYDINQEPTVGSRSEGQKRNVALLCEVLRAHNVRHSECLSFEPDE